MSSFEWRRPSRACYRTFSARPDLALASSFFVLVPTLRVGTPLATLCVVAFPSRKRRRRFQPTLAHASGSERHDAERRRIRSHAERGNED